MRHSLACILAAPPCPTGSTHATFSNFCRVTVETVQHFYVPCNHSERQHADYLQAAAPLECWLALLRIRAKQ